MKHTFEYQYPDGPYAQTYDKGYSVEIEYDGPTYVIISVEPNGDTSISGAGDELVEADVAGLNKEFEHYICSVADNPVPFCYKLGMYRVLGVIPLHIEELGNGDTFEFQFNNAIIEETIDNGNVTWNNETKTFDWSHKTHSQDRQSIVDGFIAQADQIEAMIADPKAPIPEEKLAKYTAHIEFLRNWDETYAGIDHWKVPFPTDIADWTDYQKR